MRLIDEVPLDTELTGGHALRICDACMRGRTRHRAAGVAVHPECWQERQREYQQEEAS